MNTFKSLYTNTLLLLCVFFSTSCSATGTSTEIVLVGSTPGDELIKSLLTIPTDTKVDFIRWNLKLNNANVNQNSFLLDINFGESQPNTSGFKNGGEKRSFEGTFSVSENKDVNTGSEIFYLKSKSLPKAISIIKISENLFHLLTPQNELIPGNGGWSYSLNRKETVNSGKILISSTISDNKSLQLVFEGRTPCQEISDEHPEMNTSQSCFKLKWKLILNKDSVNHLPTTYIIRKVVDNKPRDVSGKWTIIAGIPANPDAIIYKIEPDKPDEAISFLVADDNVLFFLDKNNEPYIGNENFSFTLNKKQPLTSGIADKGLGDFEGL
jgi:hypothetical protein